MTVTELAGNLYHFVRLIRVSWNFRMAGYCDKEYGVYDTYFPLVSIDIS